MVPHMFQKGGGSAGSRQEELRDGEALGSKE